MFELTSEIPRTARNDRGEIIREYPRLSSDLSAIASATAEALPALSLPNGAKEDNPRLNPLP
jgi:hypothetical protein